MGVLTEARTSAESMAKSILESLTRTYLTRQLICFFACLCLKTLTRTIRNRALQTCQPRRDIESSPSCGTLCRLWRRSISSTTAYLAPRTASTGAYCVFTKCTEGSARLEHPSKSFSLQSFPQGFQFTYEGIVMTEPAIYVLKSGRVEFRRYRRGSEARDLYESQDGEPQSGLRTVPPALAGVLLEARSSEST